MQINFEEEKREGAAKLQHFLRSKYKNGDSTDMLFECQVAQLESEAACPIVEEPSSPDDTENVEALTAEVKSLKVIMVVLIPL